MSEPASAAAASLPSGIPSIDVLNACIPLFDTLKDPHRQAILVRLIQHGPQTIGEIADSSPLSRPAVSHHIKILEQVGFISVHKVATRRVCTVRTGEVLGLLRNLVATLEDDVAAAEHCRHDGGHDATADTAR